MKKRWKSSQLVRKRKRRTVRYIDDIVLIISQANHCNRKYRMNNHGCDAFSRVLLFFWLLLLRKSWKNVHHGVQIELRSNKKSIAVWLVLKRIRDWEPYDWLLRKTNKRLADGFNRFFFNNGTAFNLSLCASVHILQFLQTAHFLRRLKPSFLILLPHFPFFLGL